MALTEKEIAFWNSFKEMLKREGIDEKHPHRLAEVITIGEFSNEERGEIDKNVVKLGMIESGENRPFANDLPDFYTPEKDIAAAMKNPADLKDVEEDRRADVQADVELWRKWIKDNVKNPFDPEHEPSEQHIKELYKAFTEGRLGLQHIAHKNRTIVADDYDISFCYAAEDGTIQLTRSSKELQKELPFALCNISNAYDLAREASNVMPNESLDDSEIVKYLNNKYGENIAEDVKTVSEPKPKKPGFFTKFLSVFGNKKAREQVNAYNKYDSAEKKLNKLIDKIAKDAYPEMKNPTETMKRLDTNVGNQNAEVTLTVHNIASAEHIRRTNEENEKKLQELTSGRSENDKEMMKYILESRQDGALPKNVRDFLSDIPGIYDTMTYIERNSSDEQVKDYFTTDDYEKRQTEAAKLAIAKLIVDDLKAGNLNTNLIKMINEGRGDKLVEAFRVTYQPAFSDADELKSWVTDTTTKIRAKYHGFTDNQFKQLTDDKMINSAKNMADRKIAADAERKIQENKEKDNRIRTNRIKALESNDIKSYSINDMRELAQVYAEEYKANPSVENFAKWKMVDSIHGRMLSDKAKSVDRKTIDSSIKQCIEQVNKLKEFKSELEAGRYNTTEKAEASFLNAIKKATENKEQLKNNSNSNQKNNNVTTNVEEQMRMK